MSITFSGQSTDFVYWTSGSCSIFAGDDMKETNHGRSS